MFNKSKLLLLRNPDIRQHFHMDANTFVRFIHRRP